MKKLIQEIDLKRVFTDHSASFVFGWKRISFTPRMGIAFRRQMMESTLFISEQDEPKEAGSTFNNKLEGRHTNAYFQTEIEYKKSNLNIKAKLPFSWQQIYLNDQISDKGQILERFLFDPSLSFNYKFNVFWKMIGSWSYNNSLGDIDRIYYGYILNNYRYLSQYAAPVSETSNHNFSLRLSYRNPITSFFNAASYRYTISRDNLIYSNLIDSDGTTILEAMQLPNTTYTHRFNGQSSKYFSSAKSTISIRANYNLSKGKSIINGELFNSKTHFYNLSPALNVHLSSWLNSEYELDATYFQTFIENTKKSNISFLKHKFNFFAFPTKFQLISLSTEYYNLEGNNNFFADLLYRYTFTKRKIDIEMRWNNILNAKSYTTFQTNAFMVSETIYLLRPSQVFLSIKFGF